ncbi:hypothetical protein AciM339_0873 [Aciduliprofundum sp. MAR08-339]|uniref:hypothetical protein n=1 Tax=Aciduliprofundum sp. (strain MAR08-339) TaxID=673860 RepID=UPI0002A4B733|nr:hypothetical protein AciM339_0873 [Aciduliprofundum sp. MAR08-339]
MEDEFIRKLREKYERGEISRETYEDILARYEEESGKEEGPEESRIFSEESVADIVDRAMETAMKGVESAMKDLEMDMEKTSSRKKGNRSYKCAGSCVLGPGRYDYISAAGSLKITGDVIAERISVSGALKSEGNIEAEMLRCSGSANIEGYVISENLNAAGVFKAKDLSGENIKISGSVSSGKLKGESIRIGGVIDAEQLEGEEIKIKLSKKKSRIGEIYGEEIRIECERGFFRKWSGKLEVRKIEGEEIHIESVVADLVKGEEVIVDDGCVIETLEAKEMKISKNARVKNVVRK